MKERKQQIELVEKMLSNSNMISKQQQSELKGRGIVEEEVGGF